MNQKKGRERDKQIINILTIIFIIVFYFIIILIQNGFAQDNSEIKPFIELSGKILPNQTVYSKLASLDVNPHAIRQIIHEMDPLLDFRHNTKPGDKIQLLLNKKRELLKFYYEVNPAEIYLMERIGDDQWRSGRYHPPLTKSWAKISGTINKSLYSSLRKIKGGEDLALQMVNIFAWEFNFDKMSHPQDKYTIIVEKFSHEGYFVRYGKILALQYEGKATGKKTAIYFSSHDAEKKDYYDLNGIALRSRAPLKYDIISSGFSYRRLHPILRKIKPHPALDLTAEIGSEVWAVASGEIIKKSYNTYNGYYLVVKHKDGYQTYYNHLSKFAEGIDEGTKVMRKQIIGYVGNTGLSTGPHLDYRIKKDGKFINPLETKFPDSYPLRVSSLSKFRKIAKEFETMLHGDSDMDSFLAMIEPESEKQNI
ncbi:MAG: M23 family metallopeptidase [bacterium]